MGDWVGDKNKFHTQELESYIPSRPRTRMTYLIKPRNTFTKHDIKFPKNKGTVYNYTTDIAYCIFFLKKSKVF